MRKSKRPNNSKRKERGRRINQYHFGIASLALITVSISFYLFSSVFGTQMQIEHGPNPNILNERSRNNQSAMASSLQSTQSNTPQSSDSKQAASYGIAAGSGLTTLSQSDLNAYFKKLKNLGVEWVRWDIDWSEIQPNGPTNYDWSGVDRVALTAQQFGIQSLGTITYTPKWARNSSCINDSHCEPANPTVFGKFAAAVAQRYSGRINTWEIWNEPNYAQFWLPTPNIQNYAAILHYSYVDIKQANPAALVLSGGLAASGNDSNGDLSPLTFMADLYKVGANKYFDAVALHPYSYPASPDLVVWWNSWQQITPIYQLMVSHGDEAKKIWITEFGAPTGGPGKPFSANQVHNFTYGEDYMTEHAQQVIMEQALAFYKPRLNWMGPFFWYSLQDVGTSNSTPENFYGIFRYNGSEKPAYSVLHQAAISGH